MSPGGVPLNTTLYWGSSSGATSYEYCLDTSDDNACTTSWVNVGTSMNASVSGLVPETWYYWQVRAKNKTLTTYANGSVSAYWSFKTTKATIVPGAFSKTSPVTASTVGWPLRFITLSWEPSSRATSYEFCVDQHDDNACTTRWVSVGLETSVRLERYGYEEDRTYYWQVRAINTIGKTYANDGLINFWSFTTNVPAVPEDKCYYFPLIH